MLTAIQEKAVKAIVKAIETGTNLIVSSTAGSGKTYVIETFSHMFNFAYLKIVAITYNNRAARELGERCANWLYTSTIHAIAYRMLKALHGNKIAPNKFVDRNYANSIIGVNETDDEREKALRYFIAKMAANIAEKAKIELTDDYDSIVDKYNDCKVVYGKKDYSGTIYKIASDIVETTVSRFLDGYEKDRYGNVLITFTDMLYLPFMLGIESKKDAVLVDESQDLNPLMLGFIQDNLKPKSIILVGDSNQAINIWAGAIEGLFNILDYETVRLNETHRNKSNGCQYVRDRFQIDHYPAKDDASDNVVVVKTLSGVYNHMENGIILSRTNHDLVVAWHKIVQDKKTARIVGDDNLIQALVKAFSNYDNLETLYDAGSIDDDTYQTTRLLVESYGSVSAAIEKVSEMLGSKLCACGKSILVKRHSRKGFPFFGCATYPKCKHTETYRKDSSKVDYLLSTVHKQKGATYDNVALLPNLYDNGDSIEENNIRFVACTRQKETLVIIEPEK